MSDTNLSEFQKQVNQFNTFIEHLSSDVVQPGVKRGFQKFGRGFVGSIQREMRGSRDNTDILHRRTGTLARAFHSDVKEQDGKLSEVVWIDKSAIHWRPHEFSAVIKPKDHKFLAIPSDFIQTAAGVSRYQSPRQVPDLDYAQLQGANGKKYPVLGKPVNGEFKVFFWLVTQVKIPARLGLRSKWAVSVPLAVPMIIGEVQKELDNKVKNTVKKIL